MYLALTERSGSIIPKVWRCDSARKKRPDAARPKRMEEMDMKYVCDVCGYVYDEEQGDPDNGIAAGTKWEDLPEDFTCPLCGVGKDQFSEEA